MAALDPRYDALLESLKPFLSVRAQNLTESVQAIFRMLDTEEARQAEAKIKSLGMKDVQLMDQREKD